MIAPRAARIALAAALAAGGCGAEKEAPPPAAQRALAPGTVAQVGRHAITVPFVAHVAQAQRVPLPEARDRAVRDALLASEAEAAKLDRGLDVQIGTRAVLARRLLHDLAAEAERAPISDEELAAATAQHWLDLDRPEGFVVVHAVVRLDADASDAKRSEARTVAEAIAVAVLPVHDRAAELAPPSASEPLDARREPPEDPLAAAFTRAADAVPHVGFETKLQTLKPVAADGRVLDPSGGNYHPEFAAAAATLKERGELSKVTSSPSGMHVIMLLAHTPARRVPEPERRAGLRDEIVNGRARASLDKLLAGARARASRAADADALLAQVGVSP